ncbi:MAG: hypothetical protein GYA88_00120 [Clostridiales bacterium]|nr:hypothetical protein [Clostridiales bacterium]
MANKLFYRGKRKKLGVVYIFAYGIAIFLLLAFVIFYSFQKYIVYSQDGVSIKHPLVHEEGYKVEKDGTIQFEPVDANLQILESNYDSVKSVAGGKLPELKALYVPMQYISPESIEKFIEIMGMYDATGLLLEVKSPTGQLLWNSGSETAAAYATNGTYDLADLVTKLHEKDIYVAALMNVNVDHLLAERSSLNALLTNGGAVFGNEMGLWVDPYSTVVRTYTLDLLHSLESIGFDEVFLNNVRVPSTDGYLGYSVQLSFIPTPTNAACSFALYIGRSMQNSKMHVSAILSPQTLHEEGGAEITGQNPQVFAKAFDRLCCETDNAGQYNYDRDKFNTSFGADSVGERYPSLMNYYPETASSWIVIVPQALLDQQFAVEEPAE